MTSDRDRLIEILKVPIHPKIGVDPAEVVADYLLANGVFILPEDLRSAEDFSISAFIEAMQMYKEKDRYIKPPCKVGDTVYLINTFYSKNPTIIKCEIDAFHITSGKNRIGHKKPSYALVRNENMKSLSTRVCFDDFGKTVFLAKEEAEQKLKELNKGE